MMENLLTMSIPDEWALRLGRASETDETLKTVETVLYSELWLVWFDKDTVFPWTPEKPLLTRTISSWIMYDTNSKLDERGDAAGSA